MSFQSSISPHSVMGIEFFPQQWKAVSAPVGPTLVLAGPGAGKTRCLTGRIAHLIQSTGADPARICAITFTNRAAQEIASRVRQQLGHVAEHLTLGTIHALCLSIIRPYAKQLDLPPGFGVADDEHQRLILQRLRVHKTRHGQMLTRFGKRKFENYPLTPQEEQLFHDYETQLRANRLIDYDDILILTRQLLEQDAAILQSTQKRWDHILVDEFQDLDATQYAVIKLLSLRHRSIFAVGDDEQSIFGWRGADPRVIAHFMHDFVIREPILLNVNCRCSKAIVDAARRVLPRTELFPRRDLEVTHESTHPVEAFGHEDEAAETRWLVEHIQADLVQNGHCRSDVAVLYRNHEMGAMVEEAMIAAGVPCQLGRGRALSDDPVVAQLASSLRLVLDGGPQLEIERLARNVLPNALYAEIQAMPGGTFFDKLRRQAQRAAGGDAGKCWRLIYQIENLTSLKRSSADLGNLIDAVLSLGIGQYESALERLYDRLDDPASLPEARRLAAWLLAAIDGNKRVLLAPAGGLEMGVRHMLRTAMPRLRVDYLRDHATPLSDDVILALSSNAPVATGVDVFSPTREGYSTTLTIFKALQHVESSRCKRSFDEYVVFDTETTDKDVDACEVVELAAVRVRGGEIVDQFRTLVRCARPISSRAAEIHGYSDTDLVDQPSLEEVWPAFRTFVGDAMLVAHNGYLFDVPVLKRLSAPIGGLAGVTFFDSLPLARHLMPTGGLRLEDLAHRFEIDAGRSHHALDDAICLARVFERLQDLRLRRARTTCLASLLDVVALGIVLEEQHTKSPEEEAILASGARRALGRFSTILEQYEQEATAGSVQCPPVAEVIDRLGGLELQKRLRKDATPQDRYPETYARLQQLVVAAQAETVEQSVQSFLDRLALSRSDGITLDPDRVCLLTFHATKGLEFSRVYVIGVENDRLPGWRELRDNLEDEIREARRVLYVAMTRAKDRLCLSYCRQRQGRTTGGTMFLDEIGLTTETTANPVSTRQ
jgi:DNA polymerase III epsilon subunit family exonuclease